MKKITLLFLLTLSVTLAGCAKQSANTPEQAVPDASDKNVEVNAESVTDTAGTDAATDEKTDTSEIKDTKADLPETDNIEQGYYIIKDTEPVDLYCFYDNTWYTGWRGKWYAAELKSDLQDMFEGYQVEYHENFDDIKNNYLPVHAKFTSRDDMIDAISDKNIGGEYTDDQLEQCKQYYMDYLKENYPGHEFNIQIGQEQLYIFFNEFGNSSRYVIKGTVTDENNVSFEMTTGTFWERGDERNDNSLDYEPVYIDAIKNSGVDLGKYSDILQNDIPNTD